MTTITEFLTARYDEDEALARSASPGGWSYFGIDSVSGSTLYDETRSIANMDYDTDDIVRAVGRPIREAEADANGNHIARHDPAHVLADIAAKRAIVALHGQAVAIDTVIDHLAQPYADHPDFDPSWRI